MAWIRRQRSRASDDGNHGGGAGSGLRCSYTNTDSSPASVGGVDAVEAAVQQALGDEQVGLVEHPGQHRAAGGEGPRAGVDVAPAVEHVEHAVELAGQRLVVAVDAAGEVDELALEALGLPGGPHALAQLGVGLDGVGPGRVGAARSTARTRAAWRCRATGRRRGGTRRGWG